MHQVQDGRVLVDLPHHLIIYTPYRSIDHDEWCELLVAHDALGGRRSADRLAVGCETLMVADEHYHHVLIVWSALQIAEQDAQSVVGIIGHRHIVAHLLGIGTLEVDALQVVWQYEWVMTRIGDYLEECALPIAENVAAF